MTRLIQSIRRNLALIFLLPSLAACSLQNSLVYYPQAYPYPSSALPAQIRVLDFNSSEGAQRAFYVAPRSGKMDHLWVMFGGNGAVALGWRDWVNQYPEANTGFLLIDYPGYGYCEGKPGAGAILESSKLAFGTLAKTLNIDEEQLWNKTAILGHSLGAAAALQFAAKHTPQQLVLVSPFTTLREIGQHVVSKAVGPLINNEYDNVARLKEVEAHGVPVHVVHGSADEVIPVEFGRELSKSGKDVKYEEVAGAHHNDIFNRGRAAVMRAMGQTEIIAIE